MILERSTLTPSQRSFLSALCSVGSTRSDAKLSAIIVGINPTFPNEQMNKLLAMLQGEEEGLILAIQSPTRSRPVLSHDIGWMSGYVFGIFLS